MIGFLRGSIVAAMFLVLACAANAPHQALAQGGTPSPVKTPVNAPPQVNVVVPPSPGDAPPPGSKPDDGKIASSKTGSTMTDSEVASPAESGRLQVLAASLTIFVLAVIVGFEVITKVPPTLHTPLMSGSNAISGITLAGALTVAGAAAFNFSSILGFIAVVLAAINVVGGFMVTHRMLAMFKKR